MPSSHFRVSAAKLAVMSANPEIPRCQLILELEISMNVCMCILVKCTSHQKLIGSLERKK